jgi:hypothetical protein
MLWPDALEAMATRHTRRIDIDSGLCLIEISFDEGTHEGISVAAVGRFPTNS